MTEKDLWYGTSGPKEAEIVIVGEAWGSEEGIEEKPFVGQSGRELTRMLAEAGIEREKVLILNTFAARPLNNQAWRFFHEKDAPAAVPLRGLHPTPFALSELERLYRQIEAFPRKLIIATGNYALWALTESTIGYETTPPDAENRRVPGGIMDWRGSMIYGLNPSKTPLLPIIHPASILRQWSNRAITVHDLKARVPMALRGDWRPHPSPIFWAPPTFEQAVGRLKLWLSGAEKAPLRLACDIETSRRLITCVGFADSANFAMAIPLVRKTPQGLDSYWTIEQEAELLRLIGKVLNHPNVEIEGQNFIYDIQYFQLYGIKPRLVFDTMLAQHLLWPGTPKGLDYISSLYCRYHWFWKEDAKEWDTKGTLEDLLLYNCLDCVRTFEAAGVLRGVITSLGLDRQWTETLARHNLALRMMNRGVRIDTKLRGTLSVRLIDELNKIYTILEKIIPQEWVDPYIKSSKARWYTSPAQQKIVFGTLLGMRLPKDRKTGRDTLGADGLKTLKSRHPEFSKVFNLLEDARSVAVFQSHFIQAPLDPDNRMRCSFKPTGTETFRWSSSKNAFDRGTNLQNIPKGDED
jgi:uracil-DNA glycosylase